MIYRVVITFYTKAKERWDFESSEDAVLFAQYAVTRYSTDPHGVTVQIELVNEKASSGDSQ